MRIGQVGCGPWGALILRDLQSLGCDVTVVARSPESRARAEAGGAAVVASPQALPAVDGVIVATSVSSHAQVLDQVLDIGVPIFVEKPLTCSAQAADRIAQRGDGRVFVMDKWRYHPGVRELGRIARSSELGRVVGLRTFRLGWGNSHADVDPIWVLAPHDLSIALEILGHIPDARYATAEIVDGEPVGLVGVCGTEPWHILEVSARRRVNTRAIHLTCEKGIAELPDSYSTEVVVTRMPSTVGKDPPVSERRRTSDEMPLLAELRTFVDYLSGGPAPVSSVRDGARNVRVLSDLRALAGLST